jgi:hypothetical protein
MYNFRYHLVTIVSIFAALVIGLLLGVALTGSDLFRDASSNLAQSLSDEFDELKTENQSLSDDLGIESLLAEELLNDWQAERLKGRTIVILERNGDTSAALISTLSKIVSDSGGIPVVVNLEVKNGLNIANEQRNAQLKKLVPQVEGEDYPVTIAKALVEEWTFAAQGQVTGMGSLFQSKYKLTDYLIDAKALSVTVDYKVAIEAIEQKNPPATSAAAVQLSAYTQAQRLKVPYGVNGIIDAAYYTPDGATKAEVDYDALRITTAFEAKGKAVALPYLHLAPEDLVAAAPPPNTETIDPVTGNPITPDPAAGEATTPGATTPGVTTTNPLADEAQGDQEPAPAPTLPEGDNYFTLLVAVDENADTALVAASDAGISCVFSPFNSKGHYNIVALLTGAKKGSFGLDRNGYSAFTKVPTDKTGNFAFRKE